ncbi:hypothetical protein ABLE93_15120 [Xanthobacter sp. KR7-65]|uniref:hypothetical protein n=1 Tax=Xanthobacter sp. KR7-65 TaxID=3156612 RepID=UPI0032B6154C
MREHPRRPVAARGPLMAAAVAGPMALCGMLPGPPALADPLPLPSTDFSLKADLKRGGSLDVAHSQGRLRVEIMKPNLPGSVVSLIDLKARSMVVRTPNLANMALEIDLPAEYALGIFAGRGQRIGEAQQVAGEPCDLWRVDPQVNSSVGPATACITPDGIALRTEVEIKGRKQTVFETTQLTRAAQDPKLFQLPPGVQVLKVPKGKLGAALGFGGAIPGLGGLGLGAGGGGGDAPAPKP